MKSISKEKGSDSMEDSRIVDLYWQRSQEAIAQTAQKYGRYCFSIAYSILENGSDADEAVNDTWLGAWNAMPPHRPQTLSTFLGKITRRTALKRWEADRAVRRGRGEVALALEELSGCIPGKGMDEELDAAELSRVLRGFLRDLSQTERRVFVCRYWYLDPIAQIANDFGFSQSKVKSMLLRTRNKLKKELEKEGIFL